jgi:ABC-2 type transport system permease protein
MDSRRGRWSMVHGRRSMVHGRGASGHGRSSGWRLFVRTVMARAYPRLIMNVREKWWLFFDVVLPLAGVCAYVFVYRANDAPPDLIGFVIIGGAMSAYWMNVLWSMGNQLFWEKESGNLALYIMAPNSMMAILLGMALGGMFTTTVRAVSILVIGSLLFDVRFAVSNTPMLVAVFALALVALYGMGMMFASMFLLLGREGWHMVNLAQEPVFLLSGTFFPIRSFNFWVAAGASIIPLTLALDAIRQLSFSSGAELGFLDVRTEAIVLAWLSVVFLVVARVLLQQLERLAIAEGRLTESRA